MHVCGIGISLDWQAEATQIKVCYGDLEAQLFGRIPIYDILLQIKHLNFQI